jgi:hypothetical protein
LALGGALFTSSTTGFFAGLPPLGAGVWTGAAYTFGSGLSYLLGCTVLAASLILAIF